MVKKRKVAATVTSSDKENNKENDMANSPIRNAIYRIMENVQLNETFHKKYLKEMKQLYERFQDHETFLYTLLTVIKTAMEADEGNEFALTTLTFCSKFVTSFNGEDTHRLLSDSFTWLLSTISKSPHIRFRLCQYVNMLLRALGPEAALDDGICDAILDYMLDRVSDVSPSVRLQAILAMQRLQVPDNPDDPVLRVYQFHLCSDPSPRVRQSVVTCMGRNFNTIPYILERLWDIDEKVRRHTYLLMSSFPVRSYKVSQRLTLLEQGLHDRSEAVRKVAITIMLQQWIESYQKDLIALISALKLDANDEEIQRFRKITKKMLHEVFQRQPVEDVLACLKSDEEFEFHRCVPHADLTLEMAIYWQCLTKHLTEKEADELDLVIPELSVFCAYVEKFCELRSSHKDKFEQMEFMYILLSLMEILSTYDLGDETGRGNLKALLLKLIKNYTLDARIMEQVVRCSERLISDQNDRLQYFIDIIREQCELNTNDLLHNPTLINKLLAECNDTELTFKLSSLKVKLLDLEENESNLLRQKDFARAHVVTEEKTIVMEEYTKLLQPLLEKQQAGEKARKSLSMNRQVRNDCILKCLQLTFHMIASPKVNSINSNVCQLYHDFICRHIASNQIAIRNWALKCGTAYSMLYEPLAKDVFEQLYMQFFKNHSAVIWETSITCIFELLDRYGVDNFIEQEKDKEDKSKKTTTGRILYNTLEFIDDEEDAQRSLNVQGFRVIYLMSHFLDTCDDFCIIQAIIKGFCQLVLRGSIKNSDILEKLLLKYFNPTTDPTINQMIGIFLNNLIERKMHSLLQPCLLPTIQTVLTAPYDSPLHEIRPETIARFFIDFTRQETHGDSLHNKIAHSFLQEMLNNVSNKELCKLLAKELLTLDLNLQHNEELKQDLRNLAEKLIKTEFDPKTIKNIIDFKDMLDGNFNPPLKRPSGEDHEESDDDDDDATTATLVNDKAQQSADSASVSSVATVLSAQGDKSSAEPAIAESADPDDSADRTLTEERTDPKATVAPVVSPPKTMYGEDNSIRHRSLRKSLNVGRGVGAGKRKNEAEKPAEHATGTRSTRQQEAAAASAGETRSKRTRAKAAEEIATTAASKGSPGRLRTRGRQKAKSKSPEPSETQKKTPEKPTTPKSTELRVENSAQREVVQIVVQAATPQKPKTPEKTSKTPSAARSKSSSPSTSSSSPKISPARGTKASQLRTQLSAQRKNDQTEAEKLNSSDIVPASPQSEQPSIRGPSTRLRRVQVNLRSVNSTTTNEQQPSKPQASTDTSSSTSSTTTTTTPFRNGRKRLLKLSPKMKQLQEMASASPLRKQQRREPQVPPPPSTPSQASSKNNSASSSPSSAKENEQPPAKSPAKAAAPATVKTPARPTTTTATAAATPKSVAKSQNNPKPITPLRQKLPKTSGSIDRRSQSLERNITTRRLAHAERQNSMIMTRKRSSLDLNSSRHSQRGSPLHQPLRKKVKLSKIPRPFKAAPQSGKSAIQNSSSSNSINSQQSSTTVTSSDEASSTTTSRTLKGSRLPQRTNTNANSMRAATRQRN